MAYHSRPTEEKNAGQKKGKRLGQLKLLEKTKGITRMEDHKKHKKGKKGKTNECNEWLVPSVL